MISADDFSDDIAFVIEEVIATGLLVSFCTIIAPDGLLGASGAPSGTYANVTGLVNLPCMDAPQPPSEIKLGATQMRAPSQVTEIAPRHVWLPGILVTLIAGWRTGYLAEITDTVAGVSRTLRYEITGAEPDSQHSQTRMELKLTTAGAVQP